MRFFEDFEAEAELPLGSYEVTREEVIEFAAEFDPQPFHLDEAAAEKSLLGGLSASGWHSSAIMMRMIVDAYLGDSACEGSPGVERLRWLRPVRPGDTLTGHSKVVEARRSASRPERGVVRFETELRNSQGEIVLDAAFAVFLGSREAGR